MSHVITLRNFCSLNLFFPNKLEGDQFPEDCEAMVPASNYHGRALCINQPGDSRGGSSFTGYYASMWTHSLSLGTKLVSSLAWDNGGELLFGKSDLEEVGFGKDQSQHFTP